METVQKTVAVSKEVSELLEGLTKFAVVAKAALKDGFQAGQDLPPILSSALADLAPALQGAEAIKDEAKETKEFAAAVALGVNELVHALKA